MPYVFLVLLEPDPCCQIRTVKLGKF